MAKGKRRLMVFLGGTAIEIVTAKIVAPYLGIPSETPIISLLIIANVLTALFADYIYKKHR